MIYPILSGLSQDRILRIFQLRNSRLSRPVDMEDKMVEVVRTQAFQQPAQPVQAEDVKAPRGRIVKRAAIGLGLLAATALAGNFGYDYWTTGRFMQSTDDAYV